MALFRPSELRGLLNACHLRPNKGLGQHFLIDGNILQKIVREAKIQPGDLVLEIGPGPGALTEALIHASARLVCIEKDPQLTLSIREHFPSALVFCEDIMDFNPRSLLEHGEGKWKVVSNLPYYLTVPILKKLIPHAEVFSSMTLMVQEEMARKMTASVNEKTYGFLSLFIQFHALCRYAFKVSRRCFYPAPKIDSAIVALQLKDALPAVSPHFFSFIRTAFEKKRKTAVNALSEAWDKKGLLAAFDRLGISHQARPQNLSFSDYWKLFHSMLLSGSSR